MPKSRGGKNSWDNLVASCQPCNRKKADRTPEEAGMALLVRPRKMTIHTSKEILRNLAIGDPMWEPYLYFENTTVQAE